MKDKEIVGNLSSLTTNELNFIWTIPDPENLFNMKAGEYIYSPPVVDNDLKWILKLYPSGASNEDKSHIAIIIGIFQKS